MKTIATILIAAWVALATSTLTILSCSAVNVQVQHCESQVDNEDGSIEFHGCRADGESRNTPEGTLKVLLPEKPKETSFLWPPQHLNN